MILVQGWKDNNVRALVLSRCQNGMDGWTVYVGTYDPKAGGTYETAKWEHKSSSGDIVPLLYYAVFSEMASWAGGDQSLKNLQDVLLTIHEQMKGVAAYIDAAYKQNKLQIHEPVIYQATMQTGAPA